jgi:MscS family membrane protein
MDRDTAMACVTSTFRMTIQVLGACLFALFLPSVSARAQTIPGTSPAATPAQADLPKDALGRSTPRGTVIGFLAAARKGDDALACQYLDTPLRGEAAEALAHELFVVLDARLPARLPQLSEAPEGSRSNPLMPDQEIVGTVQGAGRAVDIVLQRVAGNAGPVWLFSGTTLDSVPELHSEITLLWKDVALPRFLTRTRVGGVRLFEWLAVILGLPLLYLMTVLLNRMLTPLIGLGWRRLFRGSDLFNRSVLPVPARLLILALAGRWLLARLPLSLFVRQFWTNLAILLTIAAVVWLLFLLNGEVERYIRRRFPRTSSAAATSLLRVGRRVVDVLIVFAGALVVLRRFGVDPTPVLAGLGVGGIAVALAAQKTLENVIAGASLIFDQAVRVGDFLKVGDVQGTVDHIGLRSTRIRTLDRTVVSIPNSQIANASLETFSVRDKFWFHPVVGLVYETTSDQLRAVVVGIRQMLDDHPSVAPESVRVRFIHLGSFSLDVDVFAYVFARDWNHFLEIQEQLLFAVTDIVDRAGTKIAFPSQTMYVSNEQAALPAAASVPTATR